MGMESPLHFKHTNGLLAMWSWYIQHTKVVFEIQANSKQTWSAGSISVLDKCIRAALFWCTTVVYMVLLPILGPIWHVISNLLQCYWSMNMNKYAPVSWCRIFSWIWRVVEFVLLTFVSILGQSSFIGIIYLIILSWYYYLYSTEIFIPNIHDNQLWLTLSF